MRNNASLGSLTSCCSALNCLDHTMVWLRNGIMSSAFGALVLGGVAFDEFESVCALEKVPAKKRIAPMSKAGFRILEIVAGGIMDTVEIVRDSSLCPGLQSITACV